MSTSKIIAQTDLPNIHNRPWTLTEIIKKANELASVFTSEPITTDQILLRQATADDGDYECIELTIVE